MNITLVATTTTVGSLTAAEALERQAIINLGHSVALYLHTSAAPSSWAGIDLVMFTSAAQSNQLVPKYDAVPVGVVTFDARKFPHSATSTQNFASIANQRTTYWFISGSSVSDPLATGVETTVYPSTPTDAYAYVTAGSQLPASAIQWMKRDSGSSDITGFGFAVGAVMADASTNSGGRKAVIGISNPNLVTAQPVLDYENRVLEWAANLGGSDQTSPSAPTAFVSTLGNNSIATSWTASTDNVAVTGYEIHRGASAGFTADGSTLRGTSATAAYTDATVPNGTITTRLLLTTQQGTRARY